MASEKKHKLLYDILLNHSSVISLDVYNSLFKKVHFNLNRSEQVSAKFKKSETLRLQDMSQQKRPSAKVSYKVKWFDFNFALQYVLLKTKLISLSLKGKSLFTVFVNYMQMPYLQERDFSINLSLAWITTPYSN